MADRGPVRRDRPQAQHRGLPRLARGRREGLPRGPRRDRTEDRRRVRRRRRPRPSLPPGRHRRRRRLQGGDRRRALARGAGHHRGEHRHRLVSSAPCPPRPASGAPSMRRSRPPRLESPGGATVLDAGCGHDSPLRPFRPRIARLVGADIAAPGRAAGLSRRVRDRRPVRGPTSRSRRRPSTSILIELRRRAHGRSAGGVRPPAPSAPAGWAPRRDDRQPATSVHRRLPGAAQRRCARRSSALVKVSPADAHPLVGACNDPATVRRMLEDAGFVDNRLRTVGPPSPGVGSAAAHRAARPTVGDALVGGTGRPAIDDRGCGVARQLRVTPGRLMAATGHVPVTARTSSRSRRSAAPGRSGGSPRSSGRTDRRSRSSWSRSWSRASSASSTRSCSACSSTRSSSARTTRTSTCTSG